MAVLMREEDRCPGGNTDAKDTRWIDKRRRNDDKGQMMLGWCTACQSWVGVNLSKRIRPHRKRRV